MAKTDEELAQNHRYRLSDGRLAVSVTSIANFPDEGKSTRMSYAAAKIAKAGGDFRKEWDDKRDMGTQIHSHMENWLNGEGVEATESESAYLDQLERFIHDYEVEPIKQECVVLSNRYGYGGRFDLLANVTIKGERKLALIDLKTGSAYKTALTLQLNGYVHADGIAVYEDGKLSHLEPLPQIDVLAGLYVTQSDYSLIEVPFGFEELDVFLSLLIAKNGYAQLEKSLNKGDKK